MMASTFRENLRAELDFQSIKVKELSEKTGIPVASLDCYLGARSTMPSADAAVKIAAALGVSVEYLVLGAENPDGGGFSYITPEFRTLIAEIEGMERQKLLVLQNLAKDLKKL
ncbi:MAG: helix-turn-helix domain-containing protein [Spirochaetaceae bacterium]|jgi:transcriptional regulator with XRE-family HTH domain|nr:helix-turn-helix domain-containing protein [Spirochaetaceae bacterium]